MRSYFCGLSVLLVFGLVCSAVAAEKFSDYPVRPAGEYAVKAERSGITVAAEPVEDLKDQKTYFATELTPKGFLPVFVVIENGSAKDSFLFDQNNVGYAGVAAGAGPNLGLTRNGENLLKNKIRSATLAPGSSTHGFLYIPVPKKGEREKIHLQIPVTKSGTNETYVLNLIF